MTEKEINHLRTEIGMVFQGSALFDSLSVYDNVAYPLEERFHMKEDEIEKVVLEKLALVGLQDSVDLFPADLSGGMKKRIGLARAIATNPHAILYDEPTAGLDPTNVNRIDKLIQELKMMMKATSVVVTHHMESVYRIADRVALLYEKKLAFSGTLTEFKSTENPLVHEFVEGTLGE
jgi:phospholipid/cholesterol/gamma-HCH transport system ATP-binding protein